MLGVVAITYSSNTNNNKASNPHITSGWMVKWSKKKKGGGGLGYSRWTWMKPEGAQPAVTPSISEFPLRQPSWDKTSTHTHLSCNLNLTALKLPQRDTCRCMHATSNSISNQHSLIIWACACVRVTGSEGGGIKTKLYLREFWQNYVFSFNYTNASNTNMRTFFLFTTI